MASIYLVEFGCEQVKTSHDRAIGAKAILFHDLLIVHGIADVYIGIERHVMHSRIEVQHVVRRFLRMQMRIEALH